MSGFRQLDQIPNYQTERFMVRDATANLLRRMMSSHIAPLTSSPTKDSTHALEMNASHPVRAPEVALRVELHTFRTPDSEYMPKGEGLWVCAKRYSTDESVKDTKGLTLLFTHCIGSSA